MKKTVIVCDKCHKEFEEETTAHVTVFVNSNETVSNRCDICMDCYHELFNHQTEKGGESDA